MSSPPPQTITVKVLTQLPAPDSQHLLTTLPLSTTIQNLKDTLSYKITNNPPQEHIRLIHSGRLLANNAATLGDLFGSSLAQSDAMVTVHMVIRENTRLSSSAANGISNGQARNVAASSIQTQAPNTSFARPIYTNQMPSAPNTAPAPPTGATPQPNNVQHAAFRRTQNPALPPGFHPFNNPFRPGNMAGAGFQIPMQQPQVPGTLPTPEQFSASMREIARRAEATNAQMLHAQQQQLIAAHAANEARRARLNNRAERNRQESDTSEATPPRQSADIDTTQTGAQAVQSGLEPPQQPQSNAQPSQSHEPSTTQPAPNANAQIPPQVATNPQSRDSPQGSGRNTPGVPNQPQQPTLQGGQMPFQGYPAFPGQAPLPHGMTHNVGNFTMSVTTTNMPPNMVPMGGMPFPYNQMLGMPGMPPQVARNAFPQPPPQQPAQDSPSTGGSSQQLPLGQSPPNQPQAGQTTGHQQQSVHIAGAPAVFQAPPRPRNNQSAPTQGVTAYLLNSPSGPNAIVYTPSGAYSSQRSTPSPNVSSIIPTGPSQQRRLALRDRLAQRRRIIRANGGGDVQEQIQQQPAADAAQQPQNEEPNADILPVVQQLFRHLWLMIRVFGFIWLLTRGESTRRTILVVLAISTYMLVQLGAFGERPFERLRTGLEALIAGGDGRANAATERADGEQQANNGATPPARRGWRAGIEQGLALFLASLYPGVGERRVQERVRAEVEATQQREAADREREQSGGEGTEGPQQEAAAAAVE